MPTLSKNSRNAQPGNQGVRGGQSAPNLKMFEREDWTLFRTVEGLQQKAGVPQRPAPAPRPQGADDNALDTETAMPDRADRRRTPSSSRTRGPASTASRRRSRRCSRSVGRCARRSSCGCRSAARSATACGWWPVPCWPPAATLVVETRDRRLWLRPEHDGSTTVSRPARSSTRSAPASRSGSARRCPATRDPFAWVRRRSPAGRRARRTTARPRRSGTTPPQFHELLLASGAQPLRAPGCAARRLQRRQGGQDRRGGRLEPHDLRRGHARARRRRCSRRPAQNARPVRPERLGFVGRDALRRRFYAIERGSVEFGSVEPQAEIPFVVEAWVSRYHRPERQERHRARRAREPHAGHGRDREPTAVRQATRGSRVRLRARAQLRRAPTKGALRHHAATSRRPTCRSPRTARRPTSALRGHDRRRRSARRCEGAARRAEEHEERAAQKQIVLDNLDAAIAKVSGDGEYRFNERQVLYCSGRSSWRRSARS